MSESIKEIVKKTYTEVLESGSACGCSCGSECDPSAQNYSLSESYSSIDGYTEVADYGLGCGIPTQYAKIKEGDRVLDLGSGAGNDVFVARSIVGDNGFVIGVDMTEAMIAKANENKEKLGYKNVEFLLGEIEELPIPDNTVDVVVSNCVINLVPDKNRVYSEVHRVLKPKGNFSVSDIVLRGELPEGIQKAAEMYAGCISGAMQKEDYLGVIKKAGFSNIEITKERELDVPEAIMLKYASKAELDLFKANNNAIISIGVYAEK